MISTENKALCCGCGSCADVCVQKAIEMQRDDEGFWHPSIIPDKCIHCDLCESVCPFQAFQKSNNTAKMGCIVQHRDYAIRKDSTSGGAFTALASVVLERGGVVYGAAFDGSFKVLHVCATSKDELAAFRCSKYVQSDMSGVWPQIVSDLQAGKEVLFSGTPCQVAALKRRFYAESKLYLVDVICRGVAAPRLLEKYIEYLEKKHHSKIDTFRFRDKFYGYHYSVLNVKFQNGKTYRKPFHYDPYLRAFFSDQFNRQACYSCPFRIGERFGDLTIYDAWETQECAKLKQDDLGATKVIINNDKGKALLDAAKKDLRIQEIPVETMLAEQEDNWLNFDTVKAEREVFWKYEKQADAVQLFRRFYPVTIARRLRHQTKRILYCSGIFTFVDSIIKGKKHTRA